MFKFFCCSLFSDFPENIADATLDDLPNTLYNRDKDLQKPHDLHPQSPMAFDTGHHHGNHYVNHRQSHGTNPSITNGFFDGTYSVMPNLMTKYSSSSSASGLFGAMPGWTSGSGVVAVDTVHSMQNSVPYSLSDSSFISPQSCSYASVAQKGPSQSNFSMVAGQPGYSTVAMVTSDQKSCDNSNRPEQTSRRVPKSGNKARYGNVNVNVVDLMQDLERADALSGSANVNVTSAQNVANTYQQSTTSDKVKLSYSSVLQEPRKPSVAAVPSGKYPNNLDPSGVVNIGQGQQGVKGQSLQSDKVSEHNDLLVRGQSQLQGVSDNNNNNEGDVKKKRRRRRRRKKKSGDSDLADNEDGNSGANEEITLHFEDEEEFPDLGFGAAGSGEGKHADQEIAASISYSEIVKNNVST